MRKGIIEKILAVSAIAGGAAVLIAKLAKKKQCCNDCCKDDCCEDDYCDCCEDSFNSADRTYVSLSRSSEQEKTAADEETETIEETETVEDPEPAKE